MSSDQERPTVCDRPDVRAYIKRVVDAAPPLTADQRDRLYLLLFPSVRQAPPAAKNAKPVDAMEQLRQLHEGVAE